MSGRDVLFACAEGLGVILPQPKTLEKYGLTATTWLEILERQDWVCPICERFPSTGKFVTDHEHVRGWSKMPDEERARYVRGVTCWWCNRYVLASHISIIRAYRIAAYLEAFEIRLGRSST